MRKIKLFLSLLILATFGISNAWGAETATLSISSGVTANKTLTDDGGNSWSVTSDGSYTSNAKYIQVGTNSKKVTYLKLSTSSFSTKSISKIQVWGTSKANTNVTIKIYVGGNKLGESSKFTAQNASNGGTEYSVENTNDYTGEILIEISRPTSATGAIYFNKAIVTYSEPGAPEKVLSSIEISGDLTNKTYEEGEELDLADLTVTAKYDDNSEEDVTEDVEWSYTPNPLTKGTTSATVIATYEDKTATTTITGLTVNEHIITPGEYYITLNNVFFSTTAGTNISSFPTSAKQDDITVTLNGSGTKTRTDAANVRMYSGNTLTFSVPVGYLITSITFTEPSSSTQWDGEITVNPGDYDETNKSWSGLAQDVVFTFGAQNRIAKAIVTYVADVKSTLTIETPQNGTISVKNGTTEVTSGTQLSAGTSLVVTPTPKAGYVFESLNVDGSAVELTDGSYTFTMPAANVTIAATFKENEKSPATLTLSKNGVTEDITGYKQDDKVILPSITSDCVKAFVGWSANPTCNVAPEYAAGDSYTLAATAQTLYAVYATAGAGETLTITPSAVSGSADPYTFTIDAAGYSLTAKKNSGSSTPTINASAKDVRIYAKGTVTLTAPKALNTIVFNISTQGKKRLAPITASVGAIATQASGDATVTWTGDATEVTFTVGDNANYGSESDKAGQLCFGTITVTTAGSYSNYSTTCSAALANPTFSLTEGKYTEAKSVEITATEGTIYYTTDGTEPTASSTQYTAAIALNDCGEYTIKAIAISSDSQSDVVSATYTIKLPLTNSQAAPYTEAEAIAVYDGGCYDNLDVYVKGTVKTATFNSTYGNYTITLTNGFQFYRFLQAAETKFTEDIIVPGDVLVACGKLSKYETTYQLAEGCYLVERIPYEGEKTDISNTEATAYTVDKAFELIADVSSDLTKEVYVKGLVAVAPTSNPTADGQMTYSISDNGENTGNVLKVYLGLNLNGEKFTSKNDVQQGDYVVVKGKLLDYNSTYELNKGNQLVQHVKAATIKIADITMEVGETKTIAATITPDAAKTEVAYSIKENAANAISLSGNVITANAVGTATITATIATATDYMGKTIDFTVTVNAKSTKEKVVILAQYDGKWYAMTNECTDSKQMGAIEVNYKNGVLFDVDESTKASITWELAIADGKATFKNNDKYLIGGNSTTLNYANSKFEWVVDGDKYLSDNKSRTFLYNKSGIFKNYATSNAEPTQTDYSGYPVVAAPNYGMTTADVVANSYFSVADGKFVQFSTGNLQYEVGTNTWSFAAKQYEVIGGEAYTGSNNTNFGMNEPGYTGKLDLFAWSCDGKFGVNPSNADADYTGTFADWGNLVNEEGWYTLTKDEMNYLLNRKKDGKKLWALATVCGMNGLILLPDNWNKETELEYGYVPADWNYTKNQFDATAWAALEAAGAVFLPEGGTRVGGHGNKEQGGGPAEFDAHGDYFHVDNVGEMGYYWLNTQDTRTGFENCASYLILPGWSEGATDADNDDICLQPQVWSREKRRGNSVRLVKEVTPDSYYTRTVTSGDYGTICLPNGGLLLGASAFSVAKMEGTTILLDEVGTTMVAGTPYVVFPNTGATNLYVFYTDNANAPAGNANGLYGSYTRDELAPNAGNYIMLPGNKYAEVTGSGVFVAAKRAYFKVSEISTTAPAPAPGVRRIAIGQAPQVATGMENIDASAQPVKTIINGQLFILRGEKMYDAQGKLVK